MSLAVLRAIRATWSWVFSIVADASMPRISYVTDVARAIRRQLRDLGRRFTPEVIQGTHQLYVAPHRERGYLAPSVERDLAYGTDPRHRLDVHHAGLGAVVERPVLLFVHGGGFTSGDKRVGDLPFQDHLGGPCGTAWSG
jgi:acetyl esterase/lipase